MTSSWSLAHRWLSRLPGKASPKGTRPVMVLGFWSNVTCCQKVRHGNLSPSRVLSQMPVLTPIRQLLIACVLVPFAASAQQWQTVGPDGGDVRSLAADPHNSSRIFLGTSAGRLYVSNDGGRTWSRLAHLGAGTEMALDHVVIDPTDSNLIYAAAWNVQSPHNDGDLFRSRDDGKTWVTLSGMRGKSIRALALAHLDARILVAGALDGVFRSRDSGDHWERISPANHAEIKNVESVAIDPVDSSVIYVGTWHLPWKTDDAGKNWRSIKAGVIDDSDVFSIVVDSAHPSIVYISACSGIYTGTNGALLFRQLQGIPYSARRTRC